MKKTKYLAPLLLVLALASCGNKGNTSLESSSSEAPASLTKSFASKLYLGSLDAKMAYDLPCSYFDVADEVPYIKLADFCSFYKKVALGDKYELFGASGDTLTNNATKATMVFDAKNNLVTCADFNLFKSTVGETTSYHDDTFQTEMDKTAKLVSEKCTRKAGKEMNWDMGKYNMKVVSYNGDYYMPFSFYQTIFLSRLGLGVAFNGADFYFYNSLAVYKEKTNPDDPLELTDYAKAIYKGPLANIKTRSESYSKYYYGSFLFTMETSNGKLPRMDYASDLDTVLDVYGFKKKMLSSDSLIADTALCEAISTIFPDGGHTGSWGTGISVEPDSTRDLKLMGSIMNHDERMKAIYSLKDALKAQRGGAIKKGENLKTSGSTAVISFDNFTLNSSNTSPNKENVESDYDSTFGILYNSFKKIEGMGETIKNVVIDLSENGGGAVMALGEALSFITDDDISITVTDHVTGAVSTEYVKYDTDLDGDFEDKDSYEGKYNFYVLTSPCSFSCGNAFPCIASEKGWAKVIGQRSGGGDCAVGYGFSVDGAKWQMSSATSFTREDGTSVDDGAKVDYTLDYSYFYDLEKLDGYLSALPEEAEAPVKQ